MRLLRDAALLTGAALLGLVLANAGRGADPDPKAKATAALAIAQAQRQREHAVAAAAGCYDDADLKVAEKFAANEGKPLVLWIGMRCTERPAVRKALSDAVHCHLKERYGDPTPRVAVVGKDGNDYFVPREKVTDETAGKLRAKWEAVPASTKPADARPVEVSRRASPCDKCADKAGGCDCVVGGCACEATATKIAVPQTIYTAPLPQRVYVVPTPLRFQPAAPIYYGSPAGGWSGGTFYQPMPARGASAGFQFNGPFGGGFSAGACVGGSGT